MKIEDLLPIGSIVWLTDAKRALMIFGVKQENADTHEEYDYIGVLYPEGNMGTDSQFLFMHKDIERVEFRGFEDSQRAEFISKLVTFYEKNEETQEG